MMFGGRDEDRDGVSWVEVRDVLARHARLVACGCVVGGLLGLALVATKEPVYRADATLLLDGDQGSAGVLGELAALTSAPAAASELQVLTSRSVAEDVVARDGAADPARDDHERHLDLSQWADDRADRPIPAFLGTFTGGAPSFERAGADVSIDAGDAAHERFGLRVRFLSADRVAISTDRAIAALGLGGADEREYDYAPGAPIEYAGMTLRVDARGDVAGRTFLVRHLPREEAVERVMENTRARETERNSGVIRLTYTDTDPVRAARTANAICRNYLDRNEARSERRARRTVGFIEDQLTEQLEMLAAAEREVVALQRENPGAVDVSETAAALIAELSTLELERVRLRLSTSALDDALEQLHAGDFAALSRLGEELADPIVGNYVETIARLSTERDLLERQDASAYRAMVEQKLLEWTGEMQVLNVQLASLNGIVARLQSGDTSVFGSLSDTVGAGKSDALMQSYLAQWTAVEAHLRELRRDFKEGLPAITKGQAELDDLRDRILALLAARAEGLAAQIDEYQALLASYRERVDGMPAGEGALIDGATDSLRAKTLAHVAGRRAGLGERAAGLDAEIARVEARLAELPEEQRLLADPMRRLESHAEIVKFLMANQKEAEITRAATTASAEFIDVAVPPRRREGPSVPVHVALGAIVGLLSAAGLAFLRESTDRGVFSSAELEEASGLPVFGAIPDFRRGRTKVKGAGADFLALRDDPEGAAAEAYRSVRANLKFALSGAEELRALAFTSCTQGEGKSTTNVDLALAFAQGGKRVVLVDADLRRPSTHRYLDTDRGPGVSEVLRGEAAWRDCVRAGVEAGLDLIPAGKQPANPGDLLAGEAMLRLLDELKQSYDLVVFDVPPALAVADLDGFAARLDGVLLVVRNGRLSHGVVAEAVKKLERVGANLIGAVLNAARPTRGENKYGYGYGYGYGSRDAA